MNKKLKPCPFCGGEAKLFLDEASYYKSQVYCKKCGVRTNREHIPEIAVTAWNTRKPMDKVVEQLEICSVSEPVTENGVTVGSVKILPLSVAAKIVKGEVDE